MEEVGEAGDDVLGGMKSPRVGRLSDGCLSFDLSRRTLLFPTGAAAGFSDFEALSCQYHLSL